MLLLHGNPFTHLSWHKIAPRLAREFTVVATDLRGYGDSEKPPGGEDHSGYSFRAMAQDQVEVMAALGFTRFRAAGHDRGARVLHRMCLDHPGRVARAAILDIIPQHHLFTHTTREWAKASYHWFFMIQPYDLPERLMGAALDFQEAIFDAQTQGGTTRQKHLRTADAHLNKLRLYLRLAHRWRWLNDGQYRHVSEMVAEIGRLLGSWIKAT